MSIELIVVLIFIALVIALFMGHPLAFVLGGLAIIMGWTLWGPECLPFFAGRIFGAMNNYILVAVPLFIFMATFLERSGIAEGLFSGLRYLMGPLKGGVGMAVILVCTIFAACTGIIGASIVAMGLLAAPQMMRHGYQKELTYGTIAAGGSLGILIPPSIMLVIMGDQATLSVGKLFAAAIFPGLLLSALYLIYVAVRCGMHPELGPALSLEERKAVPVKKRLTMSLTSLVPPMVLILGVLGSIFVGVATPTEAAGVGAFLACVMTIAYRRFSWKTFASAVNQTAVTTCMVMIILAVAGCFTGAFLGIGGGQVVTNFVTGLGVGRWGVFALMMLIIIVLGMFLDWVGIVLICFPIFLPLAAQLGFDRLWFVMMIAINLQASFLTPPFGYALFYLKGIAPEGVTLMHIYRGVIPFIILMVIGLAVAVVFPPLTLWLPSFIK